MGMDNNEDNEEYNRYLRLMEILSKMQKEDISEEDRSNYLDLLKDIYIDIHGESFDSDDIDEYGFDDSIKFEQDLSSEEDSEIFKSYIKENDMKLNITFSEVDGLTMVNELWDCDEGITINRMYQYDHEVISSLDSYVQKEVYENMLMVVIESEEFEEAAKIRDLLKNISGDFDND